MHVHVGWAGFKHGAHYHFGTQRRYHRAGRSAVEQACVRCHRAQHVPMFGQQRVLPLCCHHHGTARGEKWLLGKAFGRGLKKGPAGHGERAHLGCAIAFHKHCRRAPGGVITRLRFAFQQEHAAMRREPVADRGARDTAADDEKVSRFSHFRMLSLLVWAFWSSLPCCTTGFSITDWLILGAKWLTASCAASKLGACCAAREQARNWIERPLRRDL